jgi:Cys-rich repeat protein
MPARLLILLVTTSLAGCWGWSFPDERMQSDGPVLDASVDVSVDAKVVIECERHADCTPRPGRPLCDPKTKTCVACLLSSDCVYTPTEKVCDSPSGTCVACLGSSDCLYSTSEPTCDTATKTCVGCLKDDECLDPQRPLWDTGSKVCIGCLKSVDCSFDKAKPVCDTSNMACVGCLTKGDCPGALVCETTSKTCVGCAQDADCPTGAVCDSSNKTCVGCLASGDCSFDTTKPTCDTAAKTCVGCLASGDCSFDANKKVCDTTLKTCVACLKSADCLYDAKQTVCSTSTKTCVQCIKSAECSGSTPACDTASNLCVGCLASADCTYAVGLTLCNTTSKTCVACLVDADCGGAKTPICDSATEVCRVCKLNAECSAGGGLCALDGSCPATNLISWVDAATTSGTKDGTKAHPYLAIKDALGQTPKHIVVAAGTYGDMTVDKSHEIYGQKGAVIKPTVCDQLLIKGAATVLLTGFTIQGNIKISDGNTKATLYANEIGPSPCVGVNATGGGPTLLLRSNLIWKHTNGGLFVDGYYTIENNFFVQNGSKANTWGGVKLKAQAPNQRFANNTVADNISKGNNASEAAIRCEGPLKLFNTLVWGNTNDLGYAKQLHPDCQPNSCDVQDGLTGPFPDAKGNISTAPNFLGTGTGAGPWHLSSPSPCDGKADKTKAPKLDYDGQLRSTTAPDIGADEI